MIVRGCVGGLNRAKKEVLLSVNAGDSLLAASHESENNDAILLMRAAKIVRKELFNFE